MCAAHSIDAETCDGTIGVQHDDASVSEPLMVLLVTTASTQSAVDTAVADTCWPCDCGDCFGDDASVSDPLMGSVETTASTQSAVKAVAADMC